MKILVGAPPVGALALYPLISWHPLYRKGRAQVPPLQCRGSSIFTRDTKTPKTNERVWLRLMTPGSFSSVLGGLLSAADDDDLYRTSGGLEFQTELLLDGRENGRSGEVRRCGRLGPCVGAARRPPTEVFLRMSTCLGCGWS